MWAPERGGRGRGGRWIGGRKEGRKEGGVDTFGLCDFCF